MVVEVNPGGRASHARPPLDAAKYGLPVAGNVRHLGRGELDSRLRVCKPAGPGLDTLDSPIMILASAAKISTARVCS